MRFGFFLEVNTLGKKNYAKTLKIERLEQTLACPINLSQTPNTIELLYVDISKKNLKHLHEKKGLKTASSNPGKDAVLWHLNKKKRF